MVLLLLIFSRLLFLFIRRIDEAKSEVADAFIIVVEEVTDAEGDNLREDDDGEILLEEEGETRFEVDGETSS